MYKICYNNYILDLINDRPINCLDKLFDLGLSIIDLKGKQILGTKEKLFGKFGKIGQMILKDDIKVMNNMNKFGEGAIKNVIERKDEYVEKIGDIASDLANDEIPTDKIKFLIYEGVYQGVSNARFYYINKNGLGMLFS